MLENPPRPTERPKPQIPSRGALRYPAFWLAIAVLLLNDHVLKGAGIAPGWLTGKLSDFSWLVVAPVGLSAMVGARSRASNAVLLGAVAALFIATELSQGVADQVASIATALGQPTRLWADPTDLIALSILPVTWHLLALRRGTGRPGRALGRVGARVGLGLAIFASVATSQPPPPAATSWATSAYLANTTIDPIAVRLRFAGADVDCSLLGSIDLGAAVSRDLFDTGITFRLSPQETVPIEPQAATFAATGGPPGAMPMPANACDIVLLSIDGAPDTIVLVSGARGTTPTMLGNGALDTVPLGRRVDVVTSAAGAPDFRVGADLPTAPLDDRTPPTDCALGRPTYAHNVGTRTGAFTLLSSTVGADGCISATMSDTFARSSTFFFCAPESFFPFVAGDTLTLARATAAGMTTSTRVSGPAGALTFFDVETARLTASPFTITAAVHETCTGERLACGAYSLPRDVEVTTDGSPPVGTLATELTTTTAAGSIARLRVGTVEATVIAPAGCDVAHATVGTRINAVLFVE